MTEPALAGSPEGLAALRGLVDTVLDAVAAGTAARSGPVPATTPAHLAAEVAAVLGDAAPADGRGAAEALDTLTRLLARGCTDPVHAACAAHLHCPPLAVAAAADFAASLLNSSLDSWDQGPSATVIEAEVVAALSRLVGYGPGATGVITSGGSESNLMGLLLARRAAVGRVGGGDVDRDGVPANARLRVYCSASAHFSVRRAAALLGLGETAVVPVAVDAAGRMDAAALAGTIDAATDSVPMAIVATAGTTDAGAIDPLPASASIARACGAWLHVDAAYGGGALLSKNLRARLAGLEAADSVALDWHKLGWQPIAAGVFLAREAASFAPLARRVAYLNPVDDEDAGYTSRLGFSLRTTRRADVFKIAVTLRACGRTVLGALVERCHTLAVHAARRLAADPRFELALDPELTTVVFRFVATAAPDQVNAALRRRLLRNGHAVVGRTERNGAIYLKLTFLNPHTGSADVDVLLDMIGDAGNAEDRGPRTSQ